MGLPFRPSSQALVLAAIVAALVLPGAAPSGAASTRGCASFDSQAAAQAYFIEHGGGAGKAVGRLDGDRDGVACEGLKGPYQGFAGFGYNSRRRFFYGNAEMPSTVAGGDEFACLYGNRHFPEGPRRLNVYRVTPDGDKPLLRRKFGIGAEANPKTGHLVWKIDARHAKGRYYMAFEERIRLHPYGPNECPAFRSRTIALPTPFG
jgi:Excalibur calcium-binding domain